MMIELEGTHAFAASPEQVWRALHQSTLLVTALPDCEHWIAIRPDRYLGRLRLHAGPLQTTLSGMLSLTSDDAAPYSYQLTAHGGDDAGKGQIQGHGRVWLQSQENKTILNYQGEIMAGGELASLGPDFLRTTAKALIRQTMTGLEQYLDSETAEETLVSSPAPAPDSLLRPSPQLVGGIMLALGSGLILLRPLYRWGLHQLARRFAAILAEENGRFQK